MAIDLAEHVDSRMALGQHGRQGRGYLGDRAECDLSDLPGRGKDVWRIT